MSATVTEQTVDGEIRIGIDAEWRSNPSVSDRREFYAHVREIASQRGNIEKFSAADHDLVEGRPEGAIERFIDTGDAGIPTKPVR